MTIFYKLLNFIKQNSMLCFGLATVLNGMLGYYFENNFKTAGFMGVLIGLLAILISFYQKKW